MIFKNMTKKEKELIAERFSISIGTLYNWEKTKPELIKIMQLGLMKEKENSLNIENVDNEVDQMKLRMIKIEETLKRIEKVNE